MTESQTRIEKRIMPRAAVLARALLIATGAGIVLRGSAAEIGHLIPAPVIDEQAVADPPAATSQIAVLAGGCFWGSRASSGTSMA